MKKRLISFLLAVSMILSILPVGAFAAYDASNNITDITFSADGVPTKTSGTGWTYKNNTLEIKSGFSFANNADYPLIKCDIDNYGTIMGGVYKGKVTNHGKISFGIFAKEPENKDGGTGTYYKISSSTGEELTFNSKLTANQAYTLATQAVKLTAPAGKVFSNGKNTYTISYFSGNIDVVLSDPTRIDLTIGNDGYPVNSNGGTQPVYNGNGWTYQTTTLESGSNKMALVIDEGTDTSALNDKVIRVPVKCAGTLTGGLYTKSVELSGNGKITGGFFTNDVTNAGLSSVAIEHDDTFTVDSFPNVTLSKVYTKSSFSNTITLKLTRPQQLQHVGAGYSFSQPSDSSSVTLTVPKGDTVILYKRAQLLRELFKVTAPDIKVGDPVNVTVEPADGVVGLGEISIAGYYRAENSGQLLDANYVSSHADRYRVVVRVGVGTVYEGATTYSAGNVGGDNSWFFTVSEAPAKYAITRKVSDDTPNLTTDVITVKVNDSEAVEAAENDTITLSLDTAQLPENTTFTGWSVTAGNDTVDVTNSTNASNASFTMPGKAVTVTYIVNISTPVETEYEITRQHGDDLPDFSVTVENAEVTAAKANATVTLSLDTAQLPEGTTFAGWNVTAGNDTVNVINGTSASNASFTMPGKAVTVSYTIDINTPVETEYEITRQHGDDLPDFSVTVENAEVTAAKANATVTLSLDTAQLPEGTTFAGWNVTAGNDTVNVINGTSANNASFTMPGKAVTVSYTVTTISDPGDTDTVISSGDDAGTGVAIVLGGAAIGGAAYLIGTQVYLTSVLPEGAAIPTNRQQLADLLWTAAGRPQPASTALFTDISAEAADSQKAARWCVEQGLLKDTGSTFKPDKHAFRPQVIKAWNDLQARLNPQK